MPPGVEPVYQPPVYTPPDYTAYKLKDPSSMPVYQPPVYVAPEPTPLPTSTIPIADVFLGLPFFTPTQTTIQATEGLSFEAGDLVSWSLPDGSTGITFASTIPAGATITGRIS